MISSFDALDQEAVSGLLTLQQLDRDTTLDTKDADKPVDSGSTPPTSTQTTPVREFKLAGMKRERDDVYTIYYESGEDKIGVPFVKGDSADTLFMRRHAAARQLFNMNRGEAFCSWRSKMISLIVQHSRWTQFRDSLQQKRYHYKAIQLIITRYTCTQWRDNNRCRSCSNRQWRTACTKPIFIMHIMPLPAFRHQIDLCEKCLMEFEPSFTESDTSAWTQRMPQIHVR